MSVLENLFATGRRCIRRVVLVGAGLSLAAAHLPAQETDPAVLLEKARYEVDVRGDAEAAIRIYRKVVEEAAGRRELAARALLELGEVYETLGREGAREAYRRIVAEFGDQGEAVEAARSRLAMLSEDEPEEPAAEGFRMRRLWSAFVPLTVGSLSPDGSRVAFIDWGNLDAEPLRGHADVALYDLAEKAFRLVTDRPSLYERGVYPMAPTWSRDGGWIAYADWARGWTHQAIRLIRPDGSDDRTVLDNRQIAHVRPMAVSSSGDFLVALTRGWDNAVGIGIVSIEGGTLEQLRSLSWSPASLALSPDDRFVLYDRPVEEESGPADLFAVAVDGSVEVPVAPGPGDDERAFWTPEGDRIVFMSDRSGRDALWSVAWEDGSPVGDPELVQDQIEGMELLGLTASGALYFRKSNARREVYTAELELEAEASMSEPTRLPEDHLLTNFRPAWSPDGERVAWLSFREPGEDSPHVVVRDRRTGEVRAHPLSFPVRDLRAVRPDWSADGRYLWVEGGDTDPGVPGRVSYRIDARTGKVSRLEHRRDFAGMSSGRVTEFHFVDGRQAEGLRALGVRLVGQTDNRLLEEGGFSLRPGEKMVRVRNGVQVVPHRYDRGLTETPPDLDTLVASGHMHSWSLSPDGTKIVLAITDGAADPNVLYVVPLDGGEPVRIGSVHPGSRGDVGEVHYETVRWGPDGERILYALRGTGPEGDEDEIWMVDAEGGTPRRLDLPLTSYELGNLRFHPDGKTIAYTLMDLEDELWLAEGLPWQETGGS